MENSPIRFLDYDVSLMLADQVRISKEEEARKFHSNNFENSHEIDLNQDNHYSISMIFEEIGYLLDRPAAARRINCKSIKLESYRDDISKISILDFKRCYDISVKARNKKMRLQLYFNY